MKKALHVLTHTKHVKRLREHPGFPHFKKKTRWMIEGVVLVTALSLVCGYLYQTMQYGSHGPTETVVESKKAITGLVCTGGYEITPIYSGLSPDGIYKSVELVARNGESVSRYVLHQAVSASGARFVSDTGTAELWEHHGEFTYSVSGEVVSVCSMPQTQQVRDVEMVPVTFTLNDLQFVMENGVADTPLKFGSSLHITLRQWGAPAVVDLDGDGDLDRVLVITYDGGGDDVFYYVGAALQNRAGSFVSTNLVFLGSKISPQSLVSAENGAYLSYAVPNELGNSSTTPDTASSLFFSYDAATGWLVSAQKKQEVTYDVSGMKLAGKKWILQTSQDLNGREYHPRSGVMYSLVFDEEGGVRGTGACSIASGEYKANEDGTLWISDLEYEHFTCSNVETIPFYEPLMMVSTYSFTSKGELVLSYLAKTRSIIFK
jgi:hypothetical protein